MLWIIYSRISEIFSHSNYENSQIWEKLENGNSQNELRKISEIQNLVMENLKHFLSFTSGLSELLKIYKIRLSQMENFEQSLNFPKFPKPTTLIITIIMPAVIESDQLQYIQNSEHTELWLIG